MIWHDVSELPKAGSLCILEESDNKGELSYRIARYVPSHGNKYPWQLEKGTYADGKRVTRWMSMGSILQECAQIGQWPTRTFDALELLFEQRGYMLKYKDVLFRRICDFGIDMYRDDQWQES